MRHTRTLTQEDEILGYNTHVLRLLHMRTLLEHEPPKWRGVDLPYLVAVEAFMLDVAPYVRYAPRLTLGTMRMKSSLLRRQSEELGETFAICLLEDSVGYNLSTLVRLTETPKSKVADFEFVYKKKRRALLECKGRTVWSGFLSARKQAIAQIEAMLEAKKNARGQCRAFVSRLFIATPGATQQSLLSILDPPAGFSELVPPEELDDMTRRHAYAEARMAGLKHLAVSLQSRDPSTPSITAARQELENRRVRDLGIGTLVGTEREVSLPAEPGAESTYSAKIIGAIEETRAKMMIERRWEALRDAAEPPEEQTELKDTSFAPGIAQVGEGEGVYSAAADGSVLAIVRS